MSSVVISGDTSGAITLAAPTVAGTNTITLPAVTGTMALSFSGMVANFAMSTAPSGWLAADGSAVSRTTYAALFAAISTTFGTGDGSTTFNLPNLGGQFTRNWISGQTTDSGRAFGSTQADAFKSHSHTFLVDTNTPNGTNNAGCGVPFGGNQANLSTSSAGGTETRPTNVALLACIKT